MATKVYEWIREGYENKVKAVPYENTAEALEVKKEIRGGDFSTAGAGATEIKKVIKKLAVSPQIVRRVGIASFEAEVNVIVYAEKGTITASITPSHIAVVVADRGPGIEDITKAMIPGYTTAPPEVREMGFGAGLGLPNIKENSDYFRIETELGVGTTVTFWFFLDGANP